MPYIGSGPLISIISVACVITLAALSWHFGRWCLSFAGLSGYKRGEPALFSAALGLTVVCLGIFVLGMSGHLSRRSFTVLFALMLAMPFIAKRNPVRTDRGQDPLPFPLPAKLLLSAAFFLSLIAALAPCTGIDALAYHLYLPKEFLRLGRMEFLPYCRETLWPFNTEMLFMAALRFQGTALAGLCHWIFYPLTAAAVYLCARRYYDADHAVWSAVFFVMTPAVFAQAGYPYVDISLAFFVFMSVYTLLIARDTDRIGAYALTGVFCGAAMGTKFFGLGCLMLLTPMVCVISRFKPSRVIAFALAALLIGGGWYLRSWLLSGNPVYPLFHDLFGGNGWGIQMDEGAGLGKSPLDLIRFPWNITLNINAFGGQMMGALFLALIPTLLIDLKKPRTASIILTVFTAGFTIFLFTQSQHARFFISVVPFLALGAASAFLRLRSMGALSRAISRTVVAILLVLHSAIFVYRTRADWPVVSGRVSAEHWLLENERSFKGFDFIRKHVDAGATLLNAAEVRYFYAPDDRRITHFPHLDTRLNKEGGSLERFLIDQPFDYIWISNTPDPAIANALKHYAYEPVFTYDFTEKPDTFHNIIFKRPSGMPKDV